jgi:hypothetical protein
MYSITFISLLFQLIGCLHYLTNVLSFIIYIAEALKTFETAGEPLATGIQPMTERVAPRTTTT